MNKFASTQTLTGMLILGLGAWVLLGWLLRNPAWVQIMPQYVAMVVNTALCFTLLGLALLAPMRHRD